MLKYDPKSYRSPQRVWDAENRQYTDHWATTAEFTMTLCDGRTIVVPEDFVYDKASIPRIAWWWLPRDDAKILIAALVHDYLYVTQQIEQDWITRKEADEIFYALIRDAGMRWTKAKLAYSAVRAGGWVAYNRRAKKLRNMHYV